MIELFLERTILFQHILMVIGGIVLVSFYFKKIIVATIPLSLLRFILLPGVTLHEFSHAIGCLIVGAKVESIKVFDKNGGEVVHGPPKFQVIGPIVISLAPIFFSLVIFYLLNEVFNNPLHSNSIQGQLVKSLDHFFANIFSIDWVNWKTWLYLYFAINLTVCVSPSKQDWRNCSKFLALILVVLALVECINFFNFKWLAVLLFNIYIPFLMVSLFCFAVLFPLYVIKKRFSRSS